MSFKEEQSRCTSYVSTGGAVSGTNAGANGTRNYSPAAIGNVTQVADLASTMTVPGSIYGNVNSTAGNAGAARSGSEYSSSGTTVLDLDGSGTYEIGRASCRERVCQYV